MCSNLSKKVFCFFFLDGLVFLLTRKTDERGVHCDLLCATVCTGTCLILSCTLATGTTDNNLVAAVLAEGMEDHAALGFNWRVHFGCWLEERGRIPCLARPFRSNLSKKKVFFFCFGFFFLSFLFFFRSRRLLVIVVLAAAEALVLVGGGDQRRHTRVLVIRREIGRDLQALGREQHADRVCGCAVRLALGDLEQSHHLAVAHPERVVADTERALVDREPRRSILTEALHEIPLNEGSEAGTQRQSHALGEVGGLEDLVDLRGVQAVGLLVTLGVVVVDRVNDADLALPAVVLDLLGPLGGGDVVGAELLRRHRGLALDQRSETLVVGDRLPREELCRHH